MKQFAKGRPLLIACYEVTEMDKIWTPVRHQQRGLQYISTALATRSQIRTLSTCSESFLDLMRTQTPQTVCLRKVLFRTTLRTEIHPTHMDVLDGGTGFNFSRRPLAKDLLSHYPSLCKVFTSRLCLCTSPDVYFCGFQDVETLIKSKMLFDIQPVQMQSGLTPGLPELVKYSVKCFSSTLMHLFLQREGVKPASEVGKLSTLSVCNLTKEGKSTVNLSRKAVSHVYPAQLGWQTTGLWVVQIRLRLLIQRPYLTWLPDQLPAMAEHRLLGSSCLWGTIGLDST